MQHQSDARILNRRTLHRDHRSLAGVLSAGMSVLDVGCGSGAITKGIAEAVGPTGTVLGIDRDKSLLEHARRHCEAASHLHFEERDVLALDFERRFDVVTASRTLQWISDVESAVFRMARATKSNGAVVVLDYNHALHSWEPVPPAAFREFYRVFLSWRQANGWDNEIGNHLPAVFEQAGLTNVTSINQDEIAKRGDDDFDQQSSLWPLLIDNLASALLQSGACTKELLDDARNAYEPWRQQSLMRQTLSLRATIGRPAPPF